jgi:hypothetical protein
MIAYKLCTRRVPGEQRDAQRQNDAQQTAKKVTRMIVCIFLAFYFSWVPLYLTLFIPYFYPKLSNSYFLFCCEVISPIIMISNGLSNALIYATFNENFRLAFKTALGIERLTGVCRSFRKRFKRNEVIVDHTLSNRPMSDQSFVNNGQENCQELTECHASRQTSN